jgi:hypothetical protein
VNTPPGRPVAGLIAAVALAASLGACTTSSTVAAKAAHHAPAFSGTAGATACNDLNQWITTAINQDMPRLPAGDWNVPASTPLGQDLASEAADLEQVNSMALNTSVINNSTGASNTTALSGDCAGYGVTLNWTPGE